MALAALAVGTSLFSWTQGNAFAPLFASLHMGLVAACQVLAWQRGECSEVIAIGDDRVEVWRGPAGITAIAEHPMWVRVMVAPDGRLWLGSQGKRVENRRLPGRSGARPVGGAVEEYAGRLAIEPSDAKRIEPAGVYTMNRRLMVRTALGLTALFGAAAALANPEPWQLNMAPGVTETSAQVYWLHNLILGICVVIGVIVFGAMAYSMFAFRKSKGAVAAKWSHNTTAEVIWTVVPVLILVAMAWPATKTVFDMYDTTESELTVKVTGYQWMWRYEILNYKGQPGGVNFVSRLDAESDRIRQSGEQPTAEQHVNYLLDVDNALVLPTDTKVRFVITADDVIHAWWVPALGWKQDAIPGMVNEAWTNIKQPGTYRGQCAELCGKDHGFMPIVVQAVPRAEFESWLAAKQAGNADEARAIAQAATRPAPRG